MAAVALTGIGAGVALAADAPPQPVDQVLDVTGSSTSVKLDSGFVSALKSLNVAPSPSGNATVTDGVAKFPITSGNVTVFKPGDVDPYVQGSLVHQGSGLTLTKGDTAVTIDNFVVDPGNPATLYGEVKANGKTLTKSTKLFDLDGSTLKPVTTQAAAGTATLDGTTVKLSDGAATALNGAFKTDALKGGTKIGIATIVVKVPSQTSATPSGGAATGGGGTSGIQDAGLLAGGAIVLLGAGGAAVYGARRRTGVTTAGTGTDQH